MAKRVKYSWRSGGRNNKIIAKTMVNFDWSYTAILRSHWIPSVLSFVAHIEMRPIWTNLNQTIQFKSYKFRQHHIMRMLPSEFLRLRYPSVNSDFFTFKTPMNATQSVKNGVAMTAVKLACCPPRLSGKHEPARVKGAGCYQGCFPRCARSYLPLAAPLRSFYEFVS